jgi:nucleoside-diphosphate-sugar epimerase
MVGTEVCKELAPHHELRLLDIRPIENPRGEAIVGSVADWETVSRSVDGMDAVVHMAIHNPGEGRTQPYEQYIQDDVDFGVKGTDLLLYASKEAGVKRFVYTSSLNVYSAKYPDAGEFLSDSDETLSAEHYGTIKWLSEELCRHYALRQGLSAIVLRFNTVTFPERWESANRDRDNPWPAPTRAHIEDVTRAVRLAVEAEDVQWGRCLISGANPAGLYDTSTADKVIGFRARYGFDAGKMFKDGAEFEPSDE